MPPDAGDAATCADGCAPGATSSNGASLTFTAIALGEEHTCALLSDGSVQCWGWCASGQCGDGTATPAPRKTRAPVSGLAGAVAIDAQTNRTCAVLQGGSVNCWGQWGTFEEVDGSNPADSVAPITVPSLLHARSVATTEASTCALLSDGHVACWGFGGDGALGAPPSSPQMVPTIVPGLASVVVLGAGKDHVCARLSDETVRCWGQNANGELGNGTTNPVSSPAQVIGLTGVQTITAGDRHTCALLQNGTVQCWGDDEMGQLGNGVGGTTTPQPTPVPVVGIANAIAVTAGGHHTCALLSDGTVECWGWNLYGQLGNGSKNALSFLPSKVAGLAGVSAIAAGGDHTCALLSGTALECWGLNQLGELGDGTTTNSNTTVAVK